MKCEVIFVLLFMTLILGNAQRISPNPCPIDRPIQQNFDVEKYTGGFWYELLRYDIYFEKGCNCGFANYKLNDDKSVAVRNCCKRLPNTTLSCTDGRAVLSYPDEVPLRGMLNVAFGTRPTNTSNYWIMSTDYTNYSIVYYCKNIENNQSSEAAWLLSRQPQLNPAAQATADDYIDKYFVRSDMYVAQQASEQCDPRDV